MVDLPAFSFQESGNSSTENGDVSILLARRLVDKKL